MAKSKAVNASEIPSDLTADEISKMDGAGASNTDIIVYPVPISAAGELDYAVRFADAKFYHNGTRLLDFNMAAYEQHAKGQAPAGVPNLLAFRHKRTEKSQAGFGLVDPSPTPHPHYATGMDLVGHLAVKDE